MDFRIGGEAGVRAELRDVVRPKTEVEVLPVVNLSAESFFFVGDATQVLAFEQSDLLMWPQTLLLWYGVSI